jgi:GABA(A) receptor-associated protein
MTFNTKLRKNNKICLYNSNKDDFKSKFRYEERKKEATNIKRKYPYRIPIIVEKKQNSQVIDIDKNKYLAPAHLTVGQFVYVIRKCLKLPPEQAIFIFIHNQIPNQASLLSAIYEEFKDDDEFLYIKYTGENTFGLD